jgi:hypothetical protein
VHCLRLCPLALVAAGCLEAPPAAAPEGDGGVAGADASGCPQTREPFDGSALGGL